MLLKEKLHILESELKSKVHFISANTEKAFLEISNDRVEQRQQLRQEISSRQEEIDRLWLVCLNQGLEPEPVANTNELIDLRCQETQWDIKDNNLNFHLDHPHSMAMGFSHLPSLDPLKYLIQKS